jgi:Na+-transporting methylmalonyl-CoA/oxaloacetate decarboxylase gamma subunit
MNKKVLLTLFAVVTAMSVFAQGRMDLRINEIAVQSDSNYVDQNGNRAGWIEIFNASYATNGIEKMFITTLKPDFIQNYFKTEEQKSNKKRNQLLQELRDSRNGEIYEIPRGDVATKVKPRTHVVFTADVDTVAGTFHLPFALTPGQYVALYDVNGDLVDEVTIPGDLLPNQTYARCSEDKIDLHAEHKFNAEDWEVRDNTTIAKAITPGKFNSRPENENIQKFKDEDPSGILLTLMSMGVVFCALLLLYILFKLFGKAFAAKDKKKEEDVAIDKAVDNSTVEETQPAGDDEAIAAICMALYQHFNAHDEESGILTFDRSHQASSAWGSKGNLLRHLPEHRDFNH